MDQELNEAGRRQAAMVCYTYFAGSCRGFYYFGPFSCIYICEPDFVRALKVARRLSVVETKPAAVYSSDLTRAVETAQMIPRACGVPDSDV
jgi:broad specificity phosphatase PhoE